MNETLTVKEALERTANELEMISLPINMIDNVGIPIKRAIEHIRQCLMAIDAAEIEEQSDKKVE